MKAVLCAMIIMMIIAFLVADMPLGEYEAAIATRQSLSAVQTAAAEPTFALRFLVAFLISALIEFIIVCLIYQPLLGSKIGKPGRWLRLGLIVSGTTLLTISILWWLLPALFASYLSYVIIGELLVIIVEAVAYKFMIPCRIRQAVLISALANFASYFIGFFLLPIIVNILF